MSYLKKLYKIGEEKINELRNKYQDPLKEFEKEVNNLKKDLNESKKLSAQINALRIRAEKDIESHYSKIKEYDKKANDIVKKGQKGEISQNAADKAALQSITLKKAYESRIETLKENIPQYDEELLKLKDTISDLKEKVYHYENELDILKTRYKLKKQKESENDLFLDDSGIISRLEKLKTKIEQHEIESDYYQKHSDELLEKTFDEENDVYNELEEIKKKIKEK